MAFQIVVVPDALRQGAEEIKRIIDDNEQIRTEIKHIASKLDRAWDGAASRSMVDSLEEFAKASDSVNEQLGESVSFLNSVAQAFEAIDDGDDSPAFAGSVKFTGKIPPGLLTIVGPDGRLNPLPPTMSLSAGRIRVVPEELREAANEVKSLIETTNGISNKVDSILNELDGSWAGKAYNRFHDQFYETKEFYESLAENLESFSQRIQFAADRYEEIDNMFI